MIRQPAETEPHDACWTAWPSHPELWQENLEPARRAFDEMIRAIAASERVELLVRDRASESEISARFGALPVRCHPIPFGDVWLRDTAPIFVLEGDALQAACFSFNGWGEKYLFDEDPAVAEQVAAAARVPRRSAAPFVLEGGAVEPDGEGTLLTTRQCLLNPNRNPGLSQAEVEAALVRHLGARKVLWLDRGLANDHTDGHIDTLVRFVSPGVVVCMEPSGAADPNRAALAEIAAALGAFRDAAGRRLEVVRIPSPGLVADDDGEPLPASYVNFYVANGAVVVPVYGAGSDEAAVEAIAGLFPGRSTVGVDARAVLTGGGAFHCVTQQQPRAPSP